MRRSYIAVEGPHDVEFVARLLPGFSRVKQLGELEEGFRLLVPTKFPHRNDLLAVNLNFVAFSAFLGDLVGQVFAMFVLTVAAAEAAIGLAILVIYFRGRGTIAVDSVNRMRG